MACYALGHLYRYGRGVPQDNKRARELYEEAARVGHLGALEFIRQDGWMII